MSFGLFLVGLLLGSSLCHFGFEMLEHMFFFENTMFLQYSFNLC